MRIVVNQALDYTINQLNATIGEREEEEEKGKAREGYIIK